MAALLCRMQARGREPEELQLCRPPAWLSFFLKDVLRVDSVDPVEPAGLCLSLSVP